MDISKKPLSVNFKSKYVPTEDDKQYQKELNSLTDEMFVEGETVNTLKNIRETLIYSLKRKYGLKNGDLKKISDAILKIHGLHEDNFDYLKNFGKFTSSKLNDVSIDANANKSEKSIKGLLKDLELSTDKLIGFDYLYRVLKELYGKDEAKRLAGDMYDYSLGLSDSSNVLIPYSYYANTPVIVRINQEVKYITLKQLYNLFSQFENKLSDRSYIDTECIEKPYVVAKAMIRGKYSRSITSNTHLTEYPLEKICLEVWDNHNGWVKVKQITKHKNECGFVLYQIDNGDFAFVTSNHPVYMADGSEKNAGELSIGDVVLSDSDMSIPDVQRCIVVPKNLAYFTGFVLGDGSVQCYDKDIRINDSKYKTGVSFTRGGNQITLYQNDIDNSYIKKLADKVFINPNYFKASDKVTRAINFQSHDYSFLLSVLFGYDCKENSFTKHLPHNILGWTTDSQEAFVAGLIDSDGTIFKNNNVVSIRLMSYATINGLADVLKTMPGIYGVRKRIDGKDISNCIYEVAFKVTKESGIISLSQRVSAEYIKNPEVFEKYHIDMNHKNVQMRVVKIISFNPEDIRETRFLKKEIEFVYDITTSSGRFYANGMVQHNCFALDASKLIVLGRDFGTLPSKPCKRVSSYISALCETIHQLASHVAGALAVGSFFTDVSWLLIYKERVSLKELRENKKIRKYVENEFQQFVHSVNFMSRNGNECPFTNISVFDKEKLQTFLTPENYGWLFPNRIEVCVDNEMRGEDENGEATYKISKEEFKNFVIDYIFEVQKIFINFFDKGDPMNNGLQYKFPVCFPKEQTVVINGKLTTFGDAFGDYDYGWTDVENLNTLYRNEAIGIRKVYKGKSDRFIRFNSSYGTPITVTPEHKLQLVSGELKCAKDIVVGDRLNLFYSVNTTSTKSCIKVSDYIPNLYVLGYKVKLTDNTRELFKWVKSGPGSGSLHNNFTRSHPFDSIQRCMESDFSLRPSEDFVKTKDSKQKGAIRNVIALDGDFGRFLGLYYAEGHNSDGEIGFSFNMNETEYIDFVGNFAKDRLGIQHVNVRVRDSQNSVQVCINSRTLGILLDILIGKYCYYKRINSDLFDTPVEFRVGLLRGIVEGDGYVNEYSMQVTTISKEGADTITYLASSLGIRSNIIEPKQRICSFNGKLEHLQYVVNLKKYDIMHYGYNLGKSYAFKETRCLNTEGYLIKDKTEYTTDIPETVYNIEVDSQEHLFQLPNGVITSNCTVNLSKHKDENGKDTLSKDNELLNYIVKKDISKYNIFTSYGTKLASCCLSSTTKVLARVDGYVRYVTVKQLFDIWEKSKNNKFIEIMGSNGFTRIVKGYSIVNEGHTLNKVTLKNGTVISTTLDHPSVKVMNDGMLVELRSEDLRIGDMLPVSKNISYDSILGGDRDFGRFVGLFGAEGQYDLRKNTNIAFSFHTKEKDLQQFVVNFAKERLAATTNVTISETWPNSTSVAVNSRMAHATMRDFFIGNFCTDKRLRSKIFNMSYDFRIGFLEGFIEGDGYTCDNSRTDYGAIHIANKLLGMDLIALANSVNIRCSYRNGGNGNDCVISILHNDKLKLKPLQDWKNGKGSSNKSTVLHDFGNYYGVQIENIEQIKTKKGMHVYDFTVENDNHLFQIANGIITHNCRLVNDVEMMSMSSSVNSFGGSNISIGSHRVCTVNLARIAYECNSYENYIDIMKYRIEEAGKILKAHRILIQKLTDMGMHPFLKNGWLNLKRMFSTFGVLGIVEAESILKQKNIENLPDDIMGDILIKFNAHCKEVSKEYGFIFNIEQIPAESFAVRLAEADTILFGNPYNIDRLYANQFLPLWKDATIYERLDIDGKYNQLLTGGGIVHAQINSEVTSLQAKNIINHAVECGCEHFALNSVYIQCEDCKTVVKGNLETCPKCGGSHLNHYTRVIGFFTKVEDWNPVRRDWEFKRRKFVDLSVANTK